METENIVYTLRNHLTLKEFHQGLIDLIYKKVEYNSINRILSLDKKKNIKT